MAQVRNYDLMIKLSSTLTSQLMWSLFHLHVDVDSLWFYFAGPGKQMLDGILNLIVPDQVVYLYTPKIELEPKELQLSVVGQNPWKFPGEKNELVSNNNNCISHHQTSTFPCLLGADKSILG